MYFCGEKFKNSNAMNTVVSSKEFVSNEDRYFDLALNEQVYIQRGNNIFHLIYSASDKTSGVVKSESRQDWAESAREFVASGNEESLFPDFFDDENLNWWQWKQE